MNKIKILFFATMRTRAKRSSMELKIPKEISIADFKDILIVEIPALEASLHHTLFSINKEYAFDEDIIPENAEIALFPPVSGG
ncbi:MAG: MoaD/ThiS family protein [Anaerolineae bacterium]|jgi:molybdopterin converting factor subunit 1|nr:MoaD/ThiS family protein [Anaerolineae bacterium]